MSRGNHLAGGLAHFGEAHLAQEIEGILIEQQHSRLSGEERAFVFVQPLRQHGVEKTHLVAGFAQHRGDLQGGERRIGLAALQLLLVEAQVIRVANQNREHRPPGWCGATRVRGIPFHRSSAHARSAAFEVSAPDGGLGLIQRRFLRHARVGGSEIAVQLEEVEALMLGRILRNTVVPTESSA